MDDMEKLSQLKNMPTRSTGTVTKDASSEKIPKNLDEFMEQLNARIVKTRHFKAGRIDNYCKVVGWKEYTPGRVPHARQDYHYDNLDRVIKLEIYEKDFTKPLTRIYFYEGDSDKVSEAVWLDRYGKIDNIHRYQWNPETGLMTDRAEYNKEGEIFYQIHSEFDMDFDPPRLIEDTWKDKAGRQIQRYVYKYDDAGDVVVEERYDSNNCLLGYYQFTYDEKRVNLVKKEWYGPDRKLRSFFEYENDENDNTTKVTLFEASGRKESSQVFIYDDIGNLVEEKWLDHEDKVFKHQKY